jgi:hypothetical protein
MLAAITNEQDPAQLAVKPPKGAAHAMYVYIALDQKTPRWVNGWSPVSGLRGVNADQAAHPLL